MKKRNSTTEEQKKMGGCDWRAAQKSSKEEDKRCMKRQIREIYKIGIKRWGGSVKHLGQQMPLILQKCVKETKTDPIINFPADKQLCILYGIVKFKTSLFFKEKNTALLFL